MRVLHYRGLDVRPAVRPQFERVVSHLETGDFRSADVRKMQAGGLYRARLNAADRLVFRYANWQGEACLLLLEVIYNHDYSRSRFLRGAAVDESKAEAVAVPPAAEKAETLVYVHPENRYVHFLDRVLSFDDAQAEAFQARPPAILIGSAGSGKTVLTLEKIKELGGEVLYVTHSPYLVENARNLYYAEGYENERQEVEFLSLRELIESIRVPAGRLLSRGDFEAWFARHRATAAIKDSHRLYEEFAGVISGSLPDRFCLNREEYLALGIRQSIFLPEERGAVYDLFERYRRMLKEDERYDLNQAAHECLRWVRPRYDFAVIDEVQDLTVLQLQLILKTLRHPYQFILCGDSNQIVHPNFFSWSKVKSFFYTRAGERSTEIVRVLDANYRNSQRVTEVANRLLRLKTARFGSIDRESNYLVRCISNRPGTVELLPDTADAKRDVNLKTRKSARFAVVVLRPEDKAEARRYFETPLVFSVQEAKGLEYADILLYNLVSGSARPFAEIAEGLTAAQADGEMRYARARDKSDKALEVYKFFVNSLYVAITRSVENLTIIEAGQNHPLIGLLGLGEVRQRSAMKARESSRDEWQREARRLELQGKDEQADAIRRTILGNQPVPWPVITPEALPALMADALDEERYNRKAKEFLFEYACVHGLYGVFDDLVRLKYNRAADAARQQQVVVDKYAREYKGKRFDELDQKIRRHGVNFRDAMNQTPLMLAASVGNPELVRRLLADGADPELRDNWGRTALQVALYRAFAVLGPARVHIGELYELLAPSSIRVRIYQRLVKIDRHQAEFLLLNSMLATTQELLTPVDKEWYRVTYRCSDILELFSFFPDRVVPPWRKRRPYVNALLARNEVSRIGAGNRELLLRARRGDYILNPTMQIEVGEVWVHVYDLVNLDALREKSGRPMVRYFADFVRDIRPDIERVLESRWLAAEEAPEPARPGERPEAAGVSTPPPPTPPDADTVEEEAVEDPVAAVAAAGPVEASPPARPVQGELPLSW
ncbi:MAG: UvrD-helicase domain-containing protein [Lentisphaeria bacterium]|nr:UvrD-helicase domain-containing protein [Lentisphaeria bacterium]